PSDAGFGYPTAVRFATEHAKAKPTQRKHYSPFDANGDIRPSLNVRYTSGDCTTESFVDGRADAWRCFTGHLIRDPCFESPVETDVVVCADSPWAHTVRHVDTSLNRSTRDVDHYGRLWGLELADGNRCVFVSGASTTVNGRRLNYFCSRSGPYLVG